MSPFCSAATQEGTDGGGMRPTVAADLHSPVCVCLWVPLVFHVTVWAYITVSMARQRDTWWVEVWFSTAVFTSAPQRCFSYRINLCCCLCTNYDAAPLWPSRCGVMFSSHYLIFAIILLLSSDRTGKHSTMPDSPADVKTQSRLTPPTMPPPPSTQGAPRNSSYTPTTCE